MRWIVGLDLRPPGRGAVHFAAWAAATPASAGKDAFSAVHVLEQEHLQAVLRHHHLDEVVEAARAEAVRVLEREGAGASLGPPAIVQGLTAVDGLEEAARRAGAEALVVGRLAPRDGRATVRLGRTARGLLRRLPAPVLVVPPDLDVARLGDGPVVALTGLADDAVEAVRFGGRLAAGLGRPLVVLHVTPDPSDGGAYLSPDTLQRLARERQVEGEMALDGWIAVHGLEPDGVVVLSGPVVERALAFAEERGAPILVTGSRRLSLPERALFTSVGSEMAASAPVPVAVVPPRA